MKRSTVSFATYAELAEHVVPDLFRASRDLIWLKILSARIGLTQQFWCHLRSFQRREVAIWTGESLQHVALYPISYLAAQHATLTESWKNSEIMVIKMPDDGLRVVDDLEISITRTYILTHGSITNTSWRKVNLPRTVHVGPVST